MRVSPIWLGRLQAAVTNLWCPRWHLMWLKIPFAVCPAKLIRRPAGSFTVRRNVFSRRRLSNIPAQFPVGIKSQLCHFLFEVLAKALEPLPATIGLYPVGPQCKSFYFMLFKCHCMIVLAKSFFEQILFLHWVDVWVLVCYQYCDELKFSN